MNPLVVAGGLGKQVDLLLRDGDPVADSDLLAGAGGQLGDGLKRFHALTLARCCRRACRISDKPGYRFTSLVKPLAEALPLPQVFRNLAGRYAKQGQAPGRQAGGVLGIAPTPPPRPA